MMTSDSDWLQREKRNMQVPSKPDTTPIAEDKQPPLATFKNSLRAWQARYQARLAAMVAVSGKAPNQTEPG